MRIGIIGNGVVGHATARCYMENYEVLIWDKVDFKSTHGGHSGLRLILDVCDIIFVCLPTPQMGVSYPPKEVGCDISALDEFFSFKLGSANLEAKAREKNFVLKSTVPIGTTHLLKGNHQLKQIVHSPEFLTERRAVIDAQCPAQLIIGNIPNPPHVEAIEETIDAAGRLVGKGSINFPVDLCHRVLYQLYQERFPGVPIRSVTAEQSEAIKLLTNAFFGVKLAFLNECHELLSSLGVEWGPVIEGMLGDGRIAHSHTKVPGPDGQYGFGGKCLPKDLYTLLTQVEMNQTPDAPDSVMRTAWGRNHWDRKREQS